MKVKKNMKRVWIGGGGRLNKEKIYIYMIDSHCCIAETNTTFKAIILQLNKIFKTMILFAGENINWLILYG